MKRYSGGQEEEVHSVLRNVDPREDIREQGRA
jgi:hypothetical protein